MLPILILDSWLPRIYDIYLTTTECTYLGTKIDRTGDNTTEIKQELTL